MVEPSWGGWSAHPGGDWRGLGRNLTFVINEDYTARIRELAKHADGNSSTTNEPAYRMLQILTRLRGGKFSL
jgi:hypothetical protein